MTWKLEKISKKLAIALEAYVNGEKEVRFFTDDGWQKEPIEKFAISALADYNFFNLS